MHAIGDNVPKHGCNSVISVADTKYKFFPIRLLGTSVGVLLSRHTCLVTFTI